MPPTITYPHRQRGTTSPTTPMEILNHVEIFPTAEQWGRALLKLREDCDLSRPEVCVMSGITIGVIQKAEQGVYSPSLTTFVALANVYKVQLDWLIQEALDA